jgi:hypothetical protein
MRGFETFVGANVAPHVADPPPEPVQFAAARAEEKRTFTELRESVIAERKAGERAAAIIREAGVALGTKRSTSVSTAPTTRSTST